MSPDDSDEKTRVGNPERERAISLLNQAFSGGYLEIAEFEERSGAVYAARTRGDLRSVLAHLPVAGQLFPSDRSGPAPVAVTEQSQPHAQSGPVQVRADWDTVRRKGVWQVPADMLITGSMATIKYDFANAVFPGPMVTVQLQVAATSVKLRLGPDHEIRYSDLDQSGWSSVKDKAGPPSRLGGAVIVLTGSLSGWSSVVIKRAPLGPSNI